MGGWEGGGGGRLTAGKGSKGSLALADEPEDSVTEPLVQVTHCASLSQSRPSQVWEALGKATSGEERQ